MSRLGIERLRECVHNYRCYGDVHLRQLARITNRLVHHHILSARHQHRGGTTAIRQRRLQAADQVSHFRQKLVRCIRLVAMRQRRDHEPMLRLHCVEQCDEGLERFGQRQQTQRMARGRGIDDDTPPIRLLAVARDELGKCQEPEDLIRAWKCGIHETFDVVRVEIGPAIHDRDDRIAPPREKALACAACIDL